MEICSLCAKVNVTIIIICMSCNVQITFQLLPNCNTPKRIVDFYDESSNTPRPYSNDSRYETLSNSWQESDKWENFFGPISITLLTKANAALFMGSLVNKFNLQLQGIFFSYQKNVLMYLFIIIKFQNIKTNT